jgi:hypothetical protein
VNFGILISVKLTVISQSPDGQIAANGISEVLVFKVFRWRIFSPLQFPRFRRSKDQTFFAGYATEAMVCRAVVKGGSGV